ncbi:uncharacterized protein JN550_006495 [Neoarthrinium moseri]|uniref:uncharacterized protein n=1 Tax=Neoarthrinium moseri TaxID=1658444 RepID=UPI001FDD9E98|nr:uncharacterized protein JN550_006495 [Neoarthrinium moseri]KAI1868007.1 hypothetical protein JN550_006495 [Neoarthrinium moseri]
MRQSDYETISPLEPCNSKAAQDFWAERSNSSCHDTGRRYSRQFEDDVSSLSATSIAEERKFFQNVADMPDEGHRIWNPRHRVSSTVSMEKGLDEVLSKPNWRPKYLRRRVLGFAVCVCLLLITATQILVGYSDNHHGLTSSYNGLHYLWTYGPTPVLTLIGAFWARIDHQAKITALGFAWPEDQLMLSEPCYWTISAYYRLSLQSVPYATMIASSLVNAGSLPYFNIRGLQESNLSYPDGVSEKYAYQRFTGPTISTTAELHATIDEFSSDCERATLNLDQVRWLDTGIPLANFTAATGDCQVYPHGWGRHIMNSAMISIFPVLHLELAKLLCKPTYNVTRIDTIKNGTDILNLVESSVPNTRTLPNVHPWDIMAAHIHSVANVLTDKFVDTATGLVWKTQNVNASDAPINVDPYMYLALGQLSRPSPSSATLLESSFLEDTTNSYYQQLAALLAHKFLSEPVSAESTGFAFLFEDRVVVNDTARHVITFLFAPSIVLLLAIMLAKPKSNTILERLRDLGRADLDAIRARLGNSEYMIRTQSDKLSREGLSEISATDIAPEEFTASDRKLQNAHVTHPSSLTHGRDNEGITDLPPGDKYLHYAWTTAPALILTVTGLIYASMDTNIRILTPFANLRHGGSFRKSAALDPMDVGIPRMLLREFRTGSLPALSGTLVALVASLLATFSSSLFVVSNIPVRISVQLKTVSSLRNDTPAYHSGSATLGLASCLILESNQSYPAFTYENLVFPELLLDLNSTANHSLIIMPQYRRQEQKWIASYGVVAKASYRPFINSCSDFSYVWAGVTSGTDPRLEANTAMTRHESLEVVDVSVVFLGTELRVDPENPPYALVESVRTSSVNNSLYKISEVYRTLPNVTSGLLDEFFSALTTSRYAIPVSYLKIHPEHRKFATPFCSNIGSYGLKNSTILSENKPIAPTHLA